MTLDQVIEVLGAQLLTEATEVIKAKEVRAGFAADLMSDALAYSAEGSLLLTGLTTNQVVWTAEILNLVGIVFVRGKMPEPQVIELANKLGLPLIRTGNSMFETAGLLYEAGLKSSAPTKERETDNIEKVVADGEF